MISPIIAQVSTPVANVQQNIQAQSTLQTANAETQVKEEVRQTQETVVQKDEAVFYQQRHDAKEEGKNKYANLYSNKKKKASNQTANTNKQEINRVNFNLEI